MKTLLIFLLLLTGNNPKTLSPVPAKTTDVNELEWASQKRELAAYKLLYENAKESSRVEMTYLYSILGIVVGFVILILTSQAFFNYRLKKTDLDNLRSEISLSVSNENQSQRDTLQKLQINYIEELNIIKATTTDNIDKFKNELIELTSNINLTIDTFKVDILKTKISDKQLFIDDQIAAVEKVIENEPELKIRLEDLRKTLLNFHYPVRMDQYEKINSFVEKLKNLYEMKYFPLLGYIQDYAWRRSDAYKESK